MTDHRECRTIGCTTTDEAPIVSPSGRRVTRRLFATAGAAFGAIGVSRSGGAQEPPPIEPRDGQSPDDDDDSPADDDGIEIEPEPTQSSTTEDTGVIFDEATSGSSRYFPETGHNLDAPFLDLWLEAGERDGAGLPLSEQRFVEGEGVIRQDFEAIALVYEPDTENQAIIRGVPLPDDVIRSLVPRNARSTSAGNAVGETVAAYWDDLGGERFFGEPRSPEFAANEMTSQVFARAVIDVDRDGASSLRKVNIEVAARVFPNDAAFAPAPPSLGTTTLVTASDGLRLRSAPSAESDVLAVLPDNAEFIAAPGEHAEWVPGYVDGYAGWVAAEFLTTPDALPTLAIEDWRLEVWQGTTLGESNVRAAPESGARLVRTIGPGEPVVVVDWVKGEEVVEKTDVWAEVEGGGFVYSRNIARSAPVQPPPPPNDAPSRGRWIDVHLTQQLMVAYDGREPVRTVVTTTGMPGWETPPGYYAINHRVANETMDSGAIGAERFYKLEDVLFTQYFTDRGHALHFAWWKTAETIGRPGSHGCLNLLLDDARFFWEWAEIGTPVICRT